MKVLDDTLENFGKNIYFNSITKGKEWKPKFVYDKIRVYKYNPKDVFPEHIDYKVKRNIIKDDIAKKSTKSCFVSEESSTCGWH